MAYRRCVCLRSFQFKPPVDAAWQDVCAAIQSLQQIRNREGFTARFEFIVTNTGLSSLYRFKPFTESTSYMTLAIHLSCSPVDSSKRIPIKSHATPCLALPCLPKRVAHCPLGCQYPQRTALERLQGVLCAFWHVDTCRASGVRPGRPSQASRAHWR